TRVKKGAGGRTLAFKLTLEDGTQGYFKPEQTVSSANWYAEVAAYHLDRALGLGRVAPVTSRRVAWSALVKAAAGDKREPELIRDKQDSLRGAFIAWLPKKPTAVETPAGWENWVRIEPFARWAVSPYQSSAAYVAALRHVRELAARGAQAPGRYEVIPTPSSEDLPAALSDMLVFDFLTLNYDRWGGDNTNVLTLGAGGPLIFLDNGDAFSAGPSRRGLMDSRLAPVQKFRKRTIEALRKLDVAALGERLNADPNGPILDENAMAGLAVRRQAVLEHVAAQQQRFGDAVFAW
ncbi:MAG TPA: hypothetical protein VHM19_18040, partial [Polyangiales bacterium]|nr:hypothetical protein [Polyangiales bacterium]